MTRVRFQASDPEPWSKVAEMPETPRHGESVMVPWRHGRLGYFVHKVTWHPGHPDHDAVVILVTRHKLASATDPANWREGP